MKCLELTYDIAKSDKNCRCTCFMDPVKKKYYKNMTKSWDVPTTSLPPWAYDQLKLSTTGSGEDYEHGSFMYEKQNTTNSTEGSHETKDSKEIVNGSKENSTGTENKSSEEGASNGEEASSGEKEASVEANSAEKSSTGDRNVTTEQSASQEKGDEGGATTEGNVPAADEEEGE